MQGLLAFGFFTERAWIWAGVGYMLGLALGEAYEIWADMCGSG